MRNNHTLTYNETTYNINDGEIKNDIFINGFQSGWYIEYDFRKIDDDIVVPTSITLRKHEDANPYNNYLVMNTTSLQMHNVMDIIKTINEN